MDPAGAERILPLRERTERGFTLRGLFREAKSGLLPPPGGKLAWRYRRVRAGLWLLAVVVVTWAIYVYFMSAGGLSRWPVYGTYHDMQADGFRLGQLHMTLEPHPKLLRAKDPYDRINSRYWALDASYYAGKYYAYWGPVPAMLQAAGKSLLGIHRTIGDAPVTLFHLCLGAFGGALLIERMGRRLFRNVSRKLIAICVLAFACANPTLHGATTAGTYHAAILAGQAWLIVGLVPAFDAVFSAESGRRRRRSLSLAGLAFACALASRVTLLPGIAFIVGMTAVSESWGFERRFRRAIVSSLWIGAPIALTGLALLVYNKVRFDQWLEFGSKIQLSGHPLFRVSSEYLLPNLYSYVLRPWETSCQFPWVYQVWSMGQAAFPHKLAIPRDYMILEPVIGWLWAVPFTWLMPFALLLAPRPSSFRTREGRTYVWCLGSFAALGSVTGLVGMGVYGATMRYASDVVNGLMLFGILGAFALKTHRLGKLAPRATSAIVSVLALATIVLGMLIGYQGYNGHFARYNPKLDQKFVKVLSFCGDRQPHVPRFWP